MEDMTQGEQIQKLTKELADLTVLSNLYKENLTKQQVEDALKRLAILTEPNK